MPTSISAHAAMNSAAGNLPTNTAFSGVACSNCMSFREGLSKCKACGHARYCGRECQMANWKEHRAACGLLRSFREFLPSIITDLPGGEPFPPGITGLTNKFSIFRVMHETYDPNTLLMDPAKREAYLEKAGLRSNAVETISKLPKRVSERAWTLATNFILFARRCSVCEKTEYDVPLGENWDWTNCDTCKFGWCCSKEHWAEYESRHTTRGFCDSYAKVTSMEIFRCNYAKRYGGLFVHIPNNPPLRTPLNPLPHNWARFFETRSAYSAEEKGLLPKDYFPAATFFLSQPVNCLYGMYQHDEKFFTTAETLTIHVVGASSVYELIGGNPSPVWEEIMHCLPAVKKMNIVFVGPEAIRADEMVGSSWLADESAFDVACCPDCVGKGRGRTISFFDKTYHEFVWKSPVFTKPDFIVAFNTGMFEEDTESWKTSLEVILDLDIPCLFTSYDKFEADADRELLRHHRARTLTEGPVLNPFAADYHTIDSSKVDYFFKINMYCICFRGRRET